MDILYLGTVPPHPGGSAIVAAPVSPRLVARGHRVRVVAAHTAALVLVAALGAAALGAAARATALRHDLESTVDGWEAALRLALATARPRVPSAGRPASH